MKKKIKLSHPSSNGQSLLELALFFPVLLMLLSGVTEFGFLLNTFLNLINGPRELARYAVAQNPFNGTGFINDNSDFYTEIAREALLALAPYSLDPARDDVIISVFTINGEQISRYPNEGHLSGESALDNTVGEWHLNGRGSNCTEGVDIDCHLTRFTSDEILAKVTQTGGAEIPPNTGVILVELYYNYHQLLNLPWLSFIGNPIQVYTYTMMPVMAATP